MKTPDAAKRPLEVVETLATALDHDDYETARSLLDPEVTYEVGGESIVGPEAVVQSYRRASEMAHALFDEVEYDHEIVNSSDESTFLIRYRDSLMVEDEIHVHLAEQEVTLGRDMLVTQIVDQVVPGERKKVDEFMARHGIRRPAV